MGIIERIRQAWGALTAPVTQPSTPTCAPVAGRVVATRVSRLPVRKPKRTKRTVQSPDVIAKRRAVICRVLRTAERPLLAKELVAAVRRLESPPVAPGRRDRKAFLHLLSEPPLSGILAHTGYGRWSRWMLRRRDLSVNGVARKGKREHARGWHRDNGFAKPDELVRTARVILATTGPLPMGELLPLVERRCAPTKVSRASLCHALRASEQVRASSTVQRDRTTTWSAA